MEEEKKIRIDSIVYDEQKMEDWLAETANRIRTERMKQNLSISRLAELSNLSVSCISKIESYQCGISLKALIKMSDALNIPAWELLAHDKIPEEIHSVDHDLEISDKGKKFEQITEFLDQETVAFILDMAKQFINIMEKES